MAAGSLRCNSKWKSLLVLIFLTVPISTRPEADFSYMKCPREIYKCSCKMIYDPEDGLSVYVECPHGNMKRIPMNKMEPNVAHLIILAPKDRPNNLTIGPVFTHPKTFSDLTVLYIVNSNVPSIGKYSFWGLRNLRILNLTFNNITSIAGDNFRGLINLTDLNLSHNHIKNLASESFQYCGSLKKLNLAHNNISALVTRLFKKLEKLNSLDLSVNPLPDLNPEAFMDLQQLTIFKCRDCKLSRINPYIYHLVPNLQNLDLGYNEIKYVLKDDFLTLKDLSKLSLDGNQITVIVDYVFGQNKKLLELNVAYNKIALLAPHSLTNLTNLTSINISYNSIEHLDITTFTPVRKSITKIDFSGNKIAMNDIAVIMQVLPHVKEVGLANYSMKFIPHNLLLFNEHLSSLDLSWNKLTGLPLTILSRNKGLKELDFSFNHLSSLGEPDLKRLEAIPTVKISNNRWICNQCSIGLMLEYMNTTVLNQTLRNLRCYEPFKLQGNLLANIRLETLDLCPLSLIAHIGIVAAVVLLVMSVLAVVMAALKFSRRRAQQRYNTQELNRRERNHEHPEELLPHTELGSLPTIHSPHRAPREHS